MSPEVSIEPCLLVVAQRLGQLVAHLLLPKGTQGGRRNAVDGLATAFGLALEPFVGALGHTEHLGGCHVETVRGCLRFRKRRHDRPPQPGISPSSPRRACTSSNDESGPGRIRSEESSASGAWGAATARTRCSSSPNAAAKVPASADSTASISASSRSFNSTRASAGTSYCPSPRIRTIMSATPSPSCPGCPA